MYIGTRLYSFEGIPQTDSSLVCLKTMKYFLIILLILLGGLYSPMLRNKTNTMRFVQPAFADIVESKEAKETATTQEIIAEIAQVFKEVPVEAILCFYKESKLKPTAMNWNCKYNGRSTSCAYKDRDNAFSVDCGVAQINTPGKYCPGNLMDYKENIKRAYQMFKKRGWQPWGVCR